MDPRRALRRLPRRRLLAVDGYHSRPARRVRCINLDYWVELPGGTRIAVALPRASAPTWPLGVPHDGVLEMARALLEGHVHLSGFVRATSCRRHFCRGRAYNLLIWCGVGAVGRCEVGESREGRA